MILNYHERLRNTLDEVKTISDKEAVLLINKGAKIIDIRDDKEIESGIIPDSILIPKSFLELKIGDFCESYDDIIILVCASGKRSMVAAQTLKQIGFNNVFSLEGGFIEWRRNQRPVITNQYLSLQEKELYQRQIILSDLGQEGQLKLKNAKVLVVGAGGIGSPILQYLAAAGIGNIGIVDNDKVEISNLHRQVIHNFDKVGQKKTLSAKHFIEKLNPYVNVTTFEEWLTHDNAEYIINQFDVVIDGTDNFETRYLVNDYCWKLKKPNIHGSIYQFEGLFSTFWNVTDSPNPCYRCAFPVPPPKEIAPSCAESGVMGFVPGIIGLLCVTECIKLILGKAELMVGKIYNINLEDWRFEVLPLDKNINCICNNTPFEIPNVRGFFDYCEK